MGVPRIETGPMTVKDFLAFTEGRPDEERWELIEGEPVLNASPVRRHQVIVGNLIYLLKAAMRERPRTWEAIPGIGVEIVPNSAPVPDVLVRPRMSAGAVCDDMILAFEVLSPSTRGRDLGWKRSAYAGLPSLQQYVVIAVDAPEVVNFRREHGFAERRTEGLDGSLDLPAISVSLRLADLYEDVHWES